MENHIAAITTRINAASAGSSLASAPVTLLGASKGQDAGRIQEAIQAGLTVFGENRVQEAAEKWPALLARYPQVRLHLIGPLQTNKAMDAVRLFHVIQTVDRKKLADSLMESMTQLKQHVSCHVQVNTGAEPQKGGVLPQDADGLIEHCKHIGLPLEGLMCIPPHDQPPAPHFALLRTIAERHGLRELSMGMSGDFEVAVRMGATCVRIGAALFGERD